MIYLSPCELLDMTLRLFLSLFAGKNAIELPSKGELEPMLQSIKKAVDNGEFDKLLEEQLAYGSRLNRIRSDIRVV